MTIINNNILKIFLIMAEVSLLSSYKISLKNMYKNEKNIAIHFRI